MDRLQEVRTKHEKLRVLLDRVDLHAVVLTRRCNFAWLTAGGQNYVNHASETGVASLVVTKDKIVCLTSNIEAGRIAREELDGLPVEVVGFDWWDAQAAGKAFRELLEGRRFAADVKVAGLPDGAAAMPAEFDRLRWSLLPSEVERYRKIGRVTGEVLEGVCRDFRQGVGEFELASMLSSALWAKGLRPHVVLVAGDDRLDAWRHPIPTAAPIRKRAMAVVCAEAGGLICSATRLVGFGRADPQWRQRQRTVCEIDGIMICNSRPGKTLGDVFRVAQEAYARFGFPDAWKQHHQGGPTGYRTREAKATPGSALPILPDQAFAWNPSLVAAKSEDTVIVGESGFEVITATGRWPSVRVCVGSVEVDRPDVLVR